MFKWFWTIFSLGAPVEFPMSKLNWNQLGGSNESDSVNQKYDSDFRRLLRKNCFLDLTAMPLFITKS